MAPSQNFVQVQWMLDLANIDLAENLGLKDTLQKIWPTVFDFQYISLLEIAENLDLADKSLVTDFPAKSINPLTLLLIGDRHFFLNDPDGKGP